jgi:hypothetical protein
LVGFLSGIIEVCDELAGVIEEFAKTSVEFTLLIRDPGLGESRYPASAIQPYSVHAGQQSGYIPFEPYHLDMQHAWPTASLQPLLQVF